MNYVSLVNHDNLSMIWKYYLSLVYLVLEKVLPHNFPFCICTQPKPMTFYMETLVALKKRSKISVKKSLNLWNNSHWVNLMIWKTNLLRLAIKQGWKI